MDQMQMIYVFRDMYDRLRQLLEDASNVAPAYKRNVDSLRKGESFYTLEGALKLRKKLAALQQEIQSLIDRIEKWGLNDDPAAKKPTAREFVLRANIRIASFLAIQQSIVGLGDIPTPEEYKKLQEAHRERIKRSDVGFDFVSLIAICAFSPVRRTHYPVRIISTTVLRKHQN